MMDFYSIQVLLGQLEGLIAPARASLSEAQGVVEEVKALEARKVEAVQAYQLAHTQRAQIVEAIENLQKQHAEMSANLSAQHQADIDKERQWVMDSNRAVTQRVAEIKAEVEKAEADAAQRIAKAEVAAAETEARVEAAKKALAALKSA